MIFSGLIICTIGAMFGAAVAEINQRDGDHPKVHIHQIMTTTDLSDSQPTPLVNGVKPPKINLFVMFRLGLFQMGLGVLLVLMVGVPIIGLVN